MRITYVGHATVLIELDGVRLLTDPFLRGRLGPLRRHGPAPAPEVTEALDAVLISHLHRDHVDLASLRRVGPGTRLLVPEGTGEFFSRRGFDAVEELVPGGSAAVGAVSIAPTEAVHDARQRGSRPDGAIGFLISGSASVYFAGDTDLFPTMASLGPVDLALLPIWGWGTNLGPGHLDPERAARAAGLIEPGVVIPIHWGTLYPRFLERLRPQPLTDPPRALAAAMRERAHHSELRVLAPGESTSLA